MNTLDPFCNLTFTFTIIYNQKEYVNVPHFSFEKENLITLWVKKNILQQYISISIVL